MYTESDFPEYIPNDSSLKWYQLEPNDAKELIIKLVLFVICPFAAFLGSLLRPTSKSSFVIYFLFGIIFCWHMDPKGLVAYDDYIGIRDLFLKYKYTMTDFYDKLWQICALRLLFFGTKIMHWNFLVKLQVLIVLAKILLHVFWLN